MVSKNVFLLKVDDEASGTSDEEKSVDGMVGFGVKVVASEFFSEVDAAILEREVRTVGNVSWEVVKGVEEVGRRGESGTVLVGIGVVLDV